MKKIIVNSIQCKHCNDIIVSKHRHNFVTCSCGVCSVDGGNDYLKRSFKNSPEEDFIELSQYEEN